MSSLLDPLREIEAACELLRKDLATQEQRLKALEQENADLRKERDLLAGDLKGYRALYAQQVREAPDPREAQWEPDLEEALSNRGNTETPLAALIRELEQR